MRIRNPRRVLLLGILLGALAFVASTPQTTLAKPYGWNDPDGPYYPPGGDGDGPVVKSVGQSRAITTLDASRAEITSTTATSTLKAYLTALRLGFGWRWIW
jgi:hypothetical protein